ncbi:MAG: TatD DNase family protein [Actinomycetota bacterium]|nr:TatD DNase family protein [Actinomycetota bacterium]
MWCDSHCHLQFDGVPDGWLARADEAGVARMVCIGTDAALSAAAIEVARTHPDRVWATVGLHPHDAKHGVETVAGLLDNPEVVAVGECGLDYHYDHSPRPVQREAFAAQIELARDRGLALVVHTREAWDDTFDILRSTGGVDRTIFHCFSGGPDEARLALDLGAYLSFSGIVTFKKADDLRAAAAMAPLDRLLVETDAPYLAPVPHRGRQNEPAFVPLVGAAVAAARGVAVEEIERATWLNAMAAFGRDHSE